MVSGLSFAAPRAGDSALYDLTISSPYQTITGTLGRKILSIDSVTQMATVEQTLDLSGMPPQVETSSVAVSSLSEESGALVVSNCAAFGGKTENILVSGRSYLACTFVQSIKGVDAINSIAEIPFMTVKSVAPQDSATTTLEMRSFSRGP